MRYIEAILRLFYFDPRPSFSMLSRGCEAAGFWWFPNFGTQICWNIAPTSSNIPRLF